ncbi:MAG TPA: GTP-binding protein, partial [Burkholderiaceae bacterium]|nr:GTP-binding protein [Burkholderiaceae bacterium]
MRASRPVPSREPVPTILIAGFLGAGKTTLLRGWLARRPAGERWGVLVNEFGALGVDRALMGGAGDDSDAVDVVEVAGGCACCASRVAFTATLTRLLRRGPWDRLFVETTGLGHPAELVDALRSPQFAPWVRVLPPVGVVDATRAGLYLDPARPGHERARAQLELARVLVLNRAGEARDEAAGSLGERLAELPPWPRAVIATASGEVALERVLAAMGEGDGRGLGEGTAVPDGDGTLGSTVRPVTFATGASDASDASDITDITDAADAADADSAVLGGPE